MWYNVIMEKRNAGGKKAEIVNWEAEEYVQRERGAGWYAGLIIVSLGLVVLSVVLKWWTFTVLVVLAAVAAVIYVSRPPRILHYSLSSKGISEGNRLYDYEDYKSFGVMHEGKKFAIVLIPRKRFSPRTVIYFPEKMGEKIVDVFGARLPMEEVKFDFLDKLVQILKF